MLIFSLELTGNLQLKVLLALADSHSSNQKINSTLAKLLEVDSELAATEADLLSQLESIQGKRRSLLTVVNMFATADTSSAAPIELPAPPPPAAETNSQLEPVSSNSRAPSLEISKATTTDSVQTEALPANQSNQTKKKASSPTRKVTQKANATRRGSGWQDYVREEFSQSSLPEAVYVVLKRSSDQVFEIPALMNNIFVDSLPTEVAGKARRQVTNILSEGARKNKRHRGQLGQYSMSKAAAKANSI